MWIRWRHRLEERAEHLAALVADVAHHLELFVDDHEELVDLLLVAQEVGEPGLDPAVVALRRLHPEGAGDRVHPDVAAVHADVPLGAGADQVAVAGEEQERPVGAALAREQPAEDGERLVGAPVGDDRAVVAADDEVGALALTDLVLDDRLDDLGVVGVVDVEPAPVGEVDPAVVDRVDHVGDGELPLGLDIDHDERRAVVVRLEAALRNLAERYGDQPVALSSGRRRSLLERDVHDRVGDPAPAAEQADGVAITRPGRAPDDGPRLVPLDGRDGFPG